MQSDPNRLKREKECVEHGNLLDSQGQFKKALAAYDKALAIDPDDADAWFNKGETLMKMGNITEAARAFDRATDLYLGREG